MHSRKIIATIFLLFCCLFAFSQIQKVGDSLEVGFSRQFPQKPVSDEKDINFEIRFKNLYQSPIKVYSWLILQMNPSVFGNFDCLLYKKGSMDMNR